MPVNRVTFSSNLLLIRQNLARVQLQYNEAIGPATTGRRLNTLSDDASAISRLFSRRQDALYIEQNQRTVNLAKLRLNFTDSRLQGTSDVLQRVRDIALSANNSTLSADQLNVLSTQVGDLKNELLNHANAQIDGKYIFSGTKSDTQPFDGNPGVFNGNSNDISVQVSKTFQVKLTIDGDTLFTGAGGGVDLFDLMDNLQTAILNGDTANITTYIGQIDTGAAQIQNAQGTVGTRLQQLEAIDNSLSEDSVSTLKDLSDLQDADLDTALSNLVTRETALRIVFASSSKILATTSGMQLQ